MVSGQSEHAVDEKGRIVIPPKFREMLGKSLVLTLGFEGCLVAYPPDRFNLLIEELAKLSYAQSKARNLQRLMLHNAEFCEIDKQGRILLPATHREHAQIQREAVVIGLIDKLEIWAKEKWREYLRNTEPSYEELAESVEGIKL